jgi:hypothetical protein
VGTCGHWVWATGHTVGGVEAGHEVFSTGQVVGLARHWVAIRGQLVNKRGHTVVSVVVGHTVTCWLHWVIEPTGHEVNDVGHWVCTGSFGQWVAVVVFGQMVTLPAGQAVSRVGQVVS